MERLSSVCSHFPSSHLPSLALCDDIKFTNPLSLADPSSLQCKEGAGGSGLHRLGCPYLSESDGLLLDLEQLIPFFFPSQGQKGNKGENGSPGLPGFLGPRGPPVRTEPNVAKISDSRCDLEFHYCPCHSNLFSTSLPPLQPSL